MTYILWKIKWKIEMPNLGEVGKEVKEGFVEFFSSDI